MSTLELQFGNADMILAKLVVELKKLQPMSQDYHRYIVAFSIKIQNFVAAVKALNRDNHLYGSDITATILTKMPTVLLSKWVDFSYPHVETSKTPKLLLLADFLHQEARKVSSSDVNLINVHELNKRKGSDRETQPHLVHYVHNEVTNNNCQFCRGSFHKLTECRRFKRALRKDRWRHVKQNGICFKCLDSRHDKATCTSPACDIDDCGQEHHRLLHYVEKTVPDVIHKPKIMQEIETQTDIVMNISANSSRVLLKVVPVTIHGPNGVFSASALLDDGSSVSLISRDLAARAGVRGSHSSMCVRGDWDGAELRCETTIMDLNVSGQDGTVFSVTMRAVDELNLPTQDLSGISFDEFVHLNSVKSNVCARALKPEILIGQDNYQLLLPLETVVGKLNEPCATRCALGWSLHGALHSPLTSNVLIQQVTAITAQSENERILHEIQDEVRRSFTIESMGVSANPRPNMDEVRAWNFLEQTSRLVEGRWHVGLPWKDENCKLPDSFPNAFKRLQGVEKKMLSSPDYASRYKGRIQHLLDNDFASELKETLVSPRTWYLPHFGVDNPNKKKLRLVYDAAATSNGLCLNDFLLKGPDLLVSLFGIMLRFRENKIAITGDIKDMFLKVKIRVEDQDALRFLWRNEPTEPVKIYSMTSLIFGANCSPFVAQFIKNTNAQRFESAMPSAVAAICSQHYMDDYIDSLPDEETAVKMVQDVTHIHKQGDFDICNWTSNSKAVLNSIPKEALGPAAVKFKIGQPMEGERTLGLIWNPKDDTLGFDVSFKRIPENILSGEQRPTKRQMLRVIMSIFDVYGFLAPFTIRGKIILQDTWQSNSDWDDYLPDDIYKKWCEWISLLKSIETVRIPRHYQALLPGTQCEPVTAVGAATIGSSGPGSTATPSEDKSYVEIELHVFCDASMKAMCAVAYWRWKEDGFARVAFITSKCRVAPVKQMSVPRLELQSAVLAARLADTIVKEHRIKPDRRVFWSDSTTVLHWVRNNTRKYKTFVAHRLGEIDELTKSTEWRYVPTTLNVADMATRDVYNESIFQNEWLHGPTFLYSDDKLWPSNIENPETEEKKLEYVNLVSKKEATLPLLDCSRFSSWKRLLGAAASVFRFINKCRKLTGDVDYTSTEQAERQLIRQAQSDSFRAEIEAVKNGSPLESDSKLKSLTPYLDEHGVLHVNGRIDAAIDVPSGVKRPIILDGRHHVARLIAHHYHQQMAHGSHETVVNELKQRYFIFRIRPTVKQVANQCMFCKIRKAQPQVPRMGELPAARLAHHQRPFTNTGIDLFGPMEVTVGRHKEKRYGVLFTCMTVRAVHLEIVNSLTTDSLIMALRRMAARRGWPKLIYSDNGTNLRGACTELNRAYVDQEALKRETTNKGIHWTFIPPASPHWGGAWERLIRCVKVALKVILKERAPRDETLNTLMTEVEGIVNSRPLMHVSVEPGSDESITPNHFILGTSSTLHAPGVFDDSDLNLRKQWRTAQRLADMYWKRWVKEVLPDMIPRTKWTKDHKPLEVGDLVLIVDPDGPRNVWPRGVVQQTFPGKDKRVRVVTVKTKSGILKRSVSRVARILSGNDCC